MALLRPRASSSSWDGSAIDHVFHAGDRRSPGRYKKGDEVRHFHWPSGSAKRNATKTLHDDLLATFVICSGLSSETLGQGNGCLGFNPAGSDANDTDPLGCHLFRRAQANGHHPSYEATPRQAARPDTVYQ